VASLAAALLFSSALQTHLSQFELTTEAQKTIYAQAYDGFNQIAELRGRRLQSVTLLSSAQDRVGLGDRKILVL
jgi:hypothetical protein